MRSSTWSSLEAVEGLMQSPSEWPWTFFKNVGSVRLTWEIYADTCVGPQGPDQNLAKLGNFFWACTKRYFPMCPSILSLGDKFPNSLKKQILDCSRLNITTRRVSCHWDVWLRRWTMCASFVLLINPTVYESRPAYWTQWTQYGGWTAFMWGGTLCRFLWLMEGLSHVLIPFWSRFSAGVSVASGVARPTAPVCPTPFSSVPKWT